MSAQSGRRPNPRPACAWPLGSGNGSACCELDCHPPAPAVRSPPWRADRRLPGPARFGWGFHPHRRCLPSGPAGPSPTGLPPLRVPPARRVSWPSRGRCQAPPPRCSAAPRVRVAAATSPCGRPGRGMPKARSFSAMCAATIWRPGMPPGNSHTEAELAAVAMLGSGTKCRRQAR
jgi:hypothetical protein